MLTARLSYAVILAGACLALAPATSQAQKRQRDRITREEILASSLRDRDLYQVIRSLRPHFVEPPKGRRTLGAGYIAPVAVYLEEKKDTGIDALKMMSASIVEEVRYLDPSASANRFGPTVNGGAVMVKLYKEPKVTLPEE